MMVSGMETRPTGVLHEKQTIPTPTPTPRGWRRPPDYDNDNRFADNEKDKGYRG
jgi:hypothetical protein